MNVQRTIKLYPFSKANTSRIREDKPFHILPSFTSIAASAFTNSLIAVGTKIIL
jgi:hypothetical protein